ncbi:MAG: radical SAM protein [Bacteroidales bacterium]|jgi:MoaA/NifB/PqqE/SkfB family radical SAM enzyme|nr:radical SAM protein [Bacteroidales bacterium]
MSFYQKHIKSYLLRILRFANNTLGKQLIIKDKQLQDKYLQYNKNRFYGPQKYFCYAPFGSLFISYDGSVSPCYACKTKDSLLDKCLEDIWHGEIFESLRSQFRKGEIPEACIFCKTHLESENYGSILANKYDHYLMQKSKMPVIAELELANTCNLECIMCSGTLSSAIRKNRENLPPVENKIPENFSEQFSKILTSLKSIELTGGDPLLIDEYYKILEIAEKINPKLDILITTNANTFTKKTEELLKKDLKLSFNVSIDSLDGEIYSQIRKNASLETALENIETFHKYTQQKKTSLGFLVCPLQINAFELPNFVDFANKYNASLSYHVVFKPAHLALWTLPSEEIEKILKNLERHNFKAYDFNSTIVLNSYNSLINLIESWYKKAILREKEGNEIEKINLEIEKAKEKFTLTIGDKTLIEKAKYLIQKTDIKELPELIYLSLANKTKEELMSGFSNFSESELIEKLKNYHQECYSHYFYHKKFSDNEKYLNNK